MARGTNREPHLATAAVNKGVEGDIPAIKEIGDRLDGKPVQGVELDMNVKITKIEYRIVDARVLDNGPAAALAYREVWKFV